MGADVDRERLEGCVVGVAVVDRTTVGGLKAGVLWTAGNDWGVVW